MNTYNNLMLAFGRLLSEYYIIASLMSGQHQLLFVINTNSDSVLFDKTINGQYNVVISFGNVYRSIITLTEILGATKVFPCILHHPTNV